MSDSLRGPLFHFAALAAAALGVLMLWAGPSDGTARAQTDTVQYARQAFRDAGYSQDEATARAIRLVCDDKADYTSTARKACQDDLDGVLAFPRPYQEIFDARPGYPWFSSLFIRLMGDSGMAAAVFVLQVLTGWLIALLGRALGMAGWWPLTGIAAYFVLPCGYVGTRMLTESATAPGVVAVMLAVAYFIEEKRTAAWLVGTTAFTWLFAVRAALAIPLAALLVVAACVAFMRTRALWAGALAALTGGALVISLSLSAALAWPSLGSGIKDLTTDHFTRPTPPDMVSRYLSAEAHFWRSFAQQISSGSLLVAVALLGLLGVARGPRATAVPYLAVAAAGVASLLVHPGDWSRMLAPLWIVAAAGLPMLWTSVGAGGGVGDSRIPARINRRRVGPSRNRVASDRRLPGG